MRIKVLMGKWSVLQLFQDSFILGDIQVKTKAENNPKWYALMAAVELAQMCGRCVRSDTDVGHTYIIDPSFGSI